MSKVPTNFDQQWVTPPDDLRLPENEVHIWRASLDVPDAVIQHLRRFLTAEEAARADRFYFAKDRNHFIIARGVLRTVLGRYLNRDPRDIRFSYNPYGKPALDLSANENRLMFNLSHSHQLALYAFCYSRQVGIDVEYMRSGIDYEQLAKHTFSPYESAMVLALPAEEKGEAFFNCWTRKEAYIKARGKGVSIPLEQFDVSLRPGDPAALLDSREDPQETTRWTLRALAPGPTYAGALAVEGDGWYSRCWQWSAEYANSPSTYDHRRSANS
ncbi:MAG: 4'-phosphopantetheinyl transferase superfamily protein [Chloroflexi bacterium]|nr:4'-phosphopantetheinyl transferase superfamily protein [Chloroflexota bacterium]